MSGTSGRYDDAILRLATVILRIVVIICWVASAVVVAAIPLTLFWRHDLMNALATEGVTGDPTAMVVSTIIVLAGGLAMLLLAIRFFRALLKLMATVEEGDPFVPENADRLRGMAWLLLGMEVLGLVLGAFGEWMLRDDQGFEFSATGLIAVLSLFVLARVFARGTAMREDIEGTV